MTLIQLSKPELEAVRSLAPLTVVTEIICKVHTTSCAVTSTIRFMSNRQHLLLTLPLLEL
jgi:hypothetical protein